MCQFSWAPSWPWEHHWSSNYVVLCFQVHQGEDQDAQGHGRQTSAPPCPQCHLSYTTRLWHPKAALHALHISLLCLFRASDIRQCAQGHHKQCYQHPLWGTGPNLYPGLPASVKYGGLGTRNAVQLAPSAFLASAAASSKSGPSDSPGLIAWHPWYHQGWASGSLETRFGHYTPIRSGSHQQKNWELPKFLRLTSPYWRKLLMLNL